MAQAPAAAGPTAMTAKDAADFCTDYPPESKLPNDLSALNYTGNNMQSANGCNSDWGAENEAKTIADKRKAACDAISSANVNNSSTAEANSITSAANSKDAKAAGTNGQASTSASSTDFATCSENAADAGKSLIDFKHQIAKRYPVWQQYVKDHNPGIKQPELDAKYQLCANSIKGSSTAPNSGYFPAVDKLFDQFDSLSKYCTANANGAQGAAAAQAELAKYAIAIGAVGLVGGGIAAAVLTSGGSSGSTANPKSTPSYSCTPATATVPESCVAVAAGSTCPTGTKCTKTCPKGVTCPALSTAPTSSGSSASTVSPCLAGQTQDPNTGSCISSAAATSTSSGTAAATSTPSSTASSTSASTSTLGSSTSAPTSSTSVVTMSQKTLNNISQSCNASCRALKAKKATALRSDSLAQ